MSDYTVNQELLRQVLQPRRYTFDFRSIEFIKDQKLMVYSACISRNQELIACGCSQSIVVMYDLITKKAIHQQSSVTYRKHQIVSISFSHYYDYIIAGNSLGDLLIYEIRCQQEFTLTLTHNFPQFHMKSIHLIHNTSVDFLLTISLDSVKVHKLKDLIGNTPQQYIAFQQPGILAAKIAFYNEYYHLFLGLRDGAVMYHKLSSLNARNNGEKIIQFPAQTFISCIDVCNDGTLIAIAYTQFNDEGHLNVYYTKKYRPIFQSQELTTSKISQLSFFADKSHLIIGSWDGSVLILDILKKQILKQYHIKTNQGVIGLFQIQEHSRFSTLLSINQNHTVQKIFFTNTKDQLFEYMPFIFWVELRIRQELQFHSDILDYLKWVEIQAVGVELFKMREQQIALTAYEKFSPLFKRAIDYEDYKERNPVLYQRFMDNHDTQQPQKNIKNIKLQPLNAVKEIDSDDDKEKEKENEKEMKEDKKKESIDSARLMGSSILFQSNILYNPITQINVMLFNRIIESFDLDNLQMLNLQKSSFLFNNRYPYYKVLLPQFKRMRSLKYLDLSFNNLGLHQSIEILDQLRGVTQIQFLNLAHNRLCDSENRISAPLLQALLDEKVSVSLRSNNFNDQDGKTILNTIQHFKKLKILDISGNLEFGKETLIALQYITILSKQIELNPQRNDQFIKMKIIEEEQQQQQEEKEIIEISKKVDEPIDEQQAMIQPVVVQPASIEQDQKTYDKQSSLSQSTSSQMSLELLCIQFKTEQCEEAMKTATDFLVNKRITNLYVYVVDNKIDNVWESSISGFYTKKYFKVTDYFASCFKTSCKNLYSCIDSLLRSAKYDGYYCLKRSCCSTLLCYKYITCAFCTFLTTSIGRILIKIFGVEESVYIFNNRSQILEDMLAKQRYILFTLFFFYTIGFYFVVIFLPVIYVSQCNGEDWRGHLLYFIFAGYSFLIEGYVGYRITQLQITVNEYTTGHWVYRSLFIFKDLFLSQLNKFQYYACVCFIIIILNCKEDIEIGWIGIAVISLNLLFDLYIAMRFIVASYINSQPLTYVDAFCQFGTLYQMNIMTNLLEKWSVQNTIMLYIEIPQKVLVSIFKSILQDIPLLLLQLIYLGNHPDKSSIGILLVSLIICIIHGVFSTIKMLTITRPSKINEDIMLTEFANHINPGHRPLKKSLVTFLQKWKRRIEQYLDIQKRKNDIIYKCLQDDDSEISKPHIYLEFGEENDVNQRKIVPLKSLRKGVTQIGNKVQRQKFGKQKIADIEGHFEKIFVRSTIDAYGPVLKSWKLNGLSPQLIDILLNDVRRQIFTKDLNWDYSFIIDQTQVRIASMQAQTPGFEKAFQFIKQFPEKEISILDLGFGCGYSTFMLATIAIKLGKIPKITAIDHYPNCEADFRSRLLEFKNLQNVQFIIKQQDLLKDLGGNEQYDFVFIGFGITKWRFNLYFEKLVTDSGLIYGFETLSQVQQQPFTYQRDIEKSFVYLDIIVEQGILQSYQQQTLNYPSKINIEHFPTCALCNRQVESNKPRFYNIYWNENLCFQCGQYDLKVQGQINDIQKIRYRSNVIFVPENSKMKIITSKYRQMLFENCTARFGMTSPDNRTHFLDCALCKTKKKFGFMYQCLECNHDIKLCNDCGFKITTERQLPQGQTQIVKCSMLHCFLRIIFPIQK